MELLGGAKYFVPIRKVVVDGIRRYLFVLKFCFLVKWMSKYGTQKNEIKKKPMYSLEEILEMLKK